MADVFPNEAGFTVERYLRLAHDGLLDAEDRVELLEGIVVAMAPQNPSHAAEIAAIQAALLAVIGPQAHVRTRLPLLAGIRSAPEPDLAVVAGQPHDYRREHPRTALLVIEVADSSLPQDRLTKARIYAAAGIPEYWIVNLRDDCIEVRRYPDAARHAYLETWITVRGDTLEPLRLAGIRIAVAEILPPQVSVER